MKKTKRFASALCVAILCASALLGCGSTTDPTVSVQQVGMLMGTPVADIDRYAGVIVSQSETTIQKEESKVIEQMLVSEGELVQEGQVLFTYDMANLRLTVQKAQLEIEQLANSVTTYGEQISQLEKEKRAASSSEQLSYTVQIQGLVLDQKEAQYNLSVKQAELADLQASAADNQVISPVTGHIQSINVDGGTDNNGNPLPLMTIVESGVFRVKGSINELNRDALFEGSAVIVRSRTDDAAIWHGTIDTINWDDPQMADNSKGYVVMESSSDSTVNASNYPFYVTLQETDGLMLGQHVYIEPDLGQEDEGEAIWLDADYVTLTDNGAFVWAATSRSTLEMRQVTLGAHDEELSRYTIEEGLSAQDYIAWPDRDLSVGMKVVYYDDSSFETDEEAQDMPAEDGAQEEYIDESVEKGFEEGSEEGSDEGSVEDVSADVPADEAAAAPAQG